MTLQQSIKLGGWLRRRAEDVLVALLSIMFVTFIIQIFFRYVLNNPVGWTEEVIVTTWLWTVLWGAAFILSEAEEIRFDIIYSNIGEGVRRVFTAVSGLVLIVLYGISLPGAYSYVSFMRVEPYVMPKKSLTGDNTERVDTRVLQVIYRVGRDEPGLFVGMQVDVFLSAEELEPVAKMGQAR